MQLNKIGIEPAIKYLINEYLWEFVFKYIWNVGNNINKKNHLKALKIIINLSSKDIKK